MEDGTEGEESIGHVPLHNFVPQTSSGEGLEMKMFIVHEAMRIVLSPLELSTNKGFIVNTKERNMWNCFPHLVSYCCDLLRGKTCRLYAMVWLSVDHVFDTRVQWRNSRTSKCPFLFTLPVRFKQDLLLQVF